ASNLAPSPDLRQSGNGYYATYPLRCRTPDMALDAPFPPRLCSSCSTRRCTDRRRGERRQYVRVGASQAHVNFWHWRAARGPGERRWVNLEGVAVTPRGLACGPDGHRRSLSSDDRKLA